MTCALRPRQLLCRLVSRQCSSLARSPTEASGGRVGVFVDVENLGFFLKADGAQRLVEWGAAHGKVVIRKAIANFSGSGVHAHQAKLTENGFDLVHVASPVSGKSTADVRLAVEVMDLQSSLDTVILATGDVDLSHVCFKLREYGKTVEGVMPRSPLSNIVKNSVDRLRIVDPKLAAKISARREAPATVPTRLAVDDMALLQRAIGLIDWSDGETKNASAVKDAMLRLDSSFSLKDTGFSAFGPLIHVSGLFEITTLVGGTLMVKPREQDTVPQEPDDHVDDLGDLGRSELFRLCKEKGIKTGGPRVTNAHLRELLSVASA